MPTVAHVLHQLYMAGAEVLASDLARRLRDRFDFVFICLDKIGPLGAQLREEGFEVICLDRRPGVDWALARRMRGDVRRCGVDLLHAHQYTPFFYTSASRALGRRPPILFTEHGRHYPDQRKLKRVVANRLLLGRADRVTAVGHFVRQALVDNEGLDGTRIEVVHNGIDPQVFAADGATRQAVRAELDAPPDRLVVIHVARFHPVKDHETSIRAFARAAQHVPDAELWLIGDGKRREASHQLATKLVTDPRRVRFLGVRKDVDRLLAGADLFMLSSLSEGISVTLLEAMAAGLAIVATEVGGNGEVIVDGETGLLSPRGDAEHLGDNLVTLLTDHDRRRAMSEAGRRRVNASFTQARMHARYAELYEQMLGTRAGDREKIWNQ